MDDKSRICRVHWVGILHLADTFAEDISGLMVARRGEAASGLDILVQYIPSNAHFVAKHNCQPCLPDTIIYSG